MRVLFLADTHLGFDLPSRPRVVRRRRGHDFFDNFERALRPALAGDVDVVVHGGDLFYRSRVPAWLVEAGLSPLKRVASTGVPVLLVPGNHERARVPRPLLAIHEGLHVFDRPRTIALEARGVRAAFVGFPYARKVRDRFRSLVAEASSGAGESDVRVLCMHQAVEGATCGPGAFTFRTGDDVIRARDLPGDIAVTLCGHVHRPQMLRPAGRSPVIYPGSTERTSFAEAPETKGVVTLELGAAGVSRVRFHRLPTRPMVSVDVHLAGLEPDAARHELAAAVASTPDDAVVQLRVSGRVPAGLSAFLRTLGCNRNITVSERVPRRTATMGA